MKTIYSIIILATLFMTGSCEETKKVLETASRVQLDGSYTITEVNGKATTGQTIVFSGLTNKVSGDGGCNSYFADYTISELSLNIGAVGATKKYCADTADMENSLFQALENVSSFSRVDGVLKLYAKDGSTVIVEAKVN